MELITLLIVFAVIGVLGFFVWKFFKKQKNYDLEVYSDVIEVTPLGAKVASRDGVSAEFKKAVDESLTDLFLDAELENYRGEWLSHSKYLIYALHTCVLSPESRTPSFLIRADNYDGTEYDQDPKAGVGMIYAAELVLEKTGERGSYVICISEDVDYVKNATRYGAEHIILYNLDRDKYNATETHIESGHPIIPEHL